MLLAIFVKRIAPRLICSRHRYQREIAVLPVQLIGSESSHDLDFLSWNGQILQPYPLQYNKNRICSENLYCLIHSFFKNGGLLFFRIMQQKIDFLNFFSNAYKKN